ncbi:hypothetical protein ACVNHC_22820 [Pannonibacter sp. Q-1]|uniref:hypothetical protein n=1 Tax=Pannonibacter indicus TaxID=466044 RepID=UPI0035B07A59
MSLSRQNAFAPIGEIVAQQVLPRLRPAQKLPLRISCIGIASYDESDHVDSFDRTLVIGQGLSPQEAMTIASQRVARGDFRISPDDAPRFRPRVMVIQDRELGLVLAGEVRSGIVTWQQPVASNAEARRVVTEASRLRGMAFTASGRGDAATARDLRYRASLLEARLVDPFWRETAAELLRLPQAA